MSVSGTNLGIAGTRGRQRNGLGAQVYPQGRERRGHADLPGDQREASRPSRPGLEAPLHQL